MTPFERHLESAIAILNAEIMTLENAGTRHGCVVESLTGKGYQQAHWYHDSKRQYVSKKNLPSVKAECERGARVRSLKARIELLNLARPDCTLRSFR